MTSQPILEALAKDFSLPLDKATEILELLNAGLEVPYLARFRRDLTGGLSEVQMRRFARERERLEELDRRRATVVRQLENAEGTPAAVIEIAKRTLDPFELEDQLLPLRNHEPESQLAIDRGLLPLAELLVQRGERPSEGAADAGSGSAPAAEAASEAAPEAPADASDATDASDAAAPASAEADARIEGEPAVESSLTHAGDHGAVEISELHHAASGVDASAAEAPAPETSATEASAPEASAPEAPAPEAPAAEAQAGQAPAAAESNADPESSEGEASAPDAASEPAATNGEPAPAESDAGAASSPGTASAETPEPAAKPEPKSESALTLTPELAKAVAEFVRPERDVHTDSQALEGAMRLLSEGLGRDARLRASLRKLLRKSATIVVRPGTNEQRVNRYKSLHKLQQPPRQIQGQKLLSLRQGLRERAITVHFKADFAELRGKVRAALGRQNDPRFDGVLDEVARRALERRLMPLLEEELRQELKTRAEEEALRTVQQNLRQLLCGPVLGPRPAAGLSADPKGAWIIVAVDEHGAPVGGEQRIETAEVDAFARGEALSAALRDSGAQWIAIAATGKGARELLGAVREAVRAVNGHAIVTLADETGLTAYANSPQGREELDMTPHGRMATSLARRLQDFAREVLKLEPRHFHVGFEQGLLTKSALRRAFQETVESSVAHLGADLRRTHAGFLQHLPGLDEAKAKALMEAVDKGEVTSRVALHTSGLLDETAYRNAAAFLRIWGSPEPLDRSSLHPEQYELARRAIESTGKPFEEVYTRTGALKGASPKELDVDKWTWRDLSREVSFPGRDPRHRMWPPNLLPADTDAGTLEKGQILEGLVTGLQSFAASIDVGLERELILHVSEITKHYARDARELLSIGQPVRVRVLGQNGNRITVSMKDVPDRERPPREPRGKGGRGRRTEGKGDGVAWPQPQRLARVAHARRDGMPGQEEGRGGGRGRGGPGGGRSFGGPGGRGRDGRGRREEGGSFGTQERAKTSKQPAYNPFANFFKDKEPDGDGGSEPQADA